MRLDARPGSSRQGGIRCMCQDDDDSEGSSVKQTKSIEPSLSYLQSLNGSEWPNRQVYTTFLRGFRQRDAHRHLPIDMFCPGGLLFFIPLKSIHSPRQRNKAVIWS